MRILIGDDFVDYELCRDVRGAHAAGVFKDFGIDSDEEDRHISEFGRRMEALDDKETYIAVKKLLYSHTETFINALYYIKQMEGEEYEQNSRNA